MRLFLRKVLCANTSNDRNSEHKHIMFGIAGLVLGGGGRNIVPAIKNAPPQKMDAVL
jgi:hypothetical protein